MIRKLISMAIKQRLVVAALAILFVCHGIFAYRNVPVEAFPDVDDPQVQVITLWPGQAAEDVERQVTLPAEQQLNGTPRRTAMRSTSMFGLSVITITFEDGVDVDVARGQVMQQMQGVNLPANAQWQLNALTTSTGEIYRYILRDSTHKLEEIRAVQDWVVEPAIRQVPGVGDVNAFGGGIKQYQVFVKPEQLSQHGVTLAQVFTALQNNNINTGGNILKTGEQALVVRGVGNLTSVEDIGNVAVAAYNARPVYVKDVADVTTGMAPRQGIVAWYQKGQDGKVENRDDVVEAIVLNRMGTNALEVIDGIKQKVEHLNKDILPQVLPGAQIVNTYDRAELVNTTLHTVMHNLLLGAVLILVICLVFTSNPRAALVIWMVIPMALLSAFILLYLKAVPANLLSFGAVDFGILVDAAVVIVEGILVAKLAAGPDADFPKVVGQTAGGLARPLIFSLFILIIALIPIFTIQRVEGRIFRPMALTFAGAILGAALVTFTLVPMVASWLLKPGVSTHENIISRFLKSIYGHALAAALKVRMLTLLLALMVAAGSLWLATQLGTEFLPKLDEGNIWLDVNMPLSISPDAAKDNERKIRTILAGFPEAKEIYTQLGRPDDGTDTKGWNHIEIAVFLPPHEQWTTRGPDGNIVEKDGLIARMNEKLSELPGITYNFSQYIEDNVEEALSGVQGELAIKLFGDDLATLQKKGEEVGRAISQVRGNADLEVEALSGQPNLMIAPNRAQIARYQLDAQTVLNLVQTGLGGQTAGSLLEGQRRFDVSLRLAPSARSDVSRISDLWVDTPLGQRIPLASLATIQSQTGASRIMRDYGQRRIAVKCSIRGRDMGSFVAEAQRTVATQVQLPKGYFITWEGQFENQRRANARLATIIPLSLLGILMLLYWAFKSLRYALMILACVPFAIIGGIGLLYLTHTNLSVSAMIGFIALSAVSVQSGMVLLAEFNRLRVGGMTLHDAVVAGGRNRVRPVLMTALIAALGMYPMAVSRGIGSEVQRPLALVIVGGMTSAVVLTLLVLPAIYEIIEHHFPKAVHVPEGLVE